MVQIRRLVCVLVLFLSMVPMFAVDSDWVPYDALIGTGNDKWAFGLSRNNDDQLSYSGNIAVNAPAWFTTLDLDGITNRGWKDAWYTNTSDPEESSFYNGRYDLIDFAFGYHVDLWETEQLSLRISPTVGFMVAGNFNFVFFQNLIHTMGKIRHVELPYEKGTYFAPKVSATLSLNGTWDMPLKRYATSQFSANLSFVTDNNIGFQTSQYIGATVGIKSGYETTLSLSLGYIWYQQYTDWKTQTLLLDFQKGWRLGFLVNAGVLDINYWHALQSTDGYTVYSIDVMGFFQPRTWKETDLNVVVGYSFFHHDNYNTLQFGIPIASGWSLLLENLYIAGNPTNKEVEISTDPTQLARLKKGFSMWSVGAQYNVPDSWSAGWFSPFVSMSLGVARWELAQLNNMMPAASLPWQVWTQYTFIMDAVIGFSLLPEGLICAGNTSYRLFVSGGLTWIPQAAEIADLINASNLTDLYPGKVNKPEYFIPRVTVGLQMSIDI